MRPYERGYQRNWWRIRNIYLITRFSRQPAAPSFQAVRANHLLHHTDKHALLEATKLAPVSPSLVNWAIFVGQTDVFGRFLDGSLEKTFATFAGPKQEDCYRQPTFNV